MSLPDQTVNCQKAQCLFYPIASSHTSNTVRSNTCQTNETTSSNCCLLSISKHNQQKQASVIHYLSPILGNILLTSQKLFTPNQSEQYSFACLSQQFLSALMLLNPFSMLSTSPHLILEIPFSLLAIVNPFHPSPSM